jgi:hypothetical protein
MDRAPGVTTPAEGCREVHQHAIGFGGHGCEIHDEAELPSAGAAETPWRQTSSHSAADAKLVCLRLGGLPGGRECGTAHRMNVSTGDLMVAALQPNGGQGAQGDRGHEPSRGPTDERRLRVCFAWFHGQPFNAIASWMQARNEVRQMYCCQRWGVDSGWCKARCYLSLCYS